MRLHLFCSGTIRTWKHLLVRGEPTGIRFTVPVPFYLLEHRKGLFLFDTGQQVPKAKPSEDADFITLLTDEERAVNQLRRKGIRPEDLSGIILSHGHTDHTAGLPDFPGVPRYIRAEEMQCSKISGMVQAETEKWYFPEGEADLFNDGEIVLLPTPGHTDGHQSLLLTLDNGEKILLAADAAYTEKALEDEAPEAEKELPYWQTLRRLREYASQDVRIITGHDPLAWNKLYREFA